MRVRRKATAEVRKEARAERRGESRSSVLKSRSGRTRMLRTSVRALGGREDVEKLAGSGPVDRQGTNASTLEDVQGLFRKAGALLPPHDPKDLCELFEETAILRPNVDAYATNIDGHGHHYKPVLDVKGDDALDKLRDALWLERFLQSEDGLVPDGPLEASDAEVEKRLEKLVSEMRVEQFMLDSFFAGCSVDRSFVSLRRETRQDLEVTGNGYWEVIRRRTSNRVAQFNLLKSYSMRLMPMGEELVELDMPMRTSPLTVGTERIERRFRRFIQITEMGKQTYFKEFGDPRVMSSKTGNFYEDEEAMFRKEGTSARLATEVLHFKIPSPSSAYGVPRWSGALYAVMGTAKADEVNFLYFDNKAVPPLALLVSGGRVTEDSVEKIEDFIEDELKGSENFHKILIIQAESPGGADGENNGKLKIELKPLTNAQHAEGLFMKYEERNTDRLGMSFRMPRLLRGDIRDFNRASADAALKFTDSQVFGPERQEFDHTINRVLADMGIRFWYFVSNGVQISNPEDMSKVITEAAKAGVIWPALALELMGEFVFNRDMPLPDEDWAFQPVILTQTGLKAGQELEDPAGAEAQAPKQGKPAAKPAARQATGKSRGILAQQRARARKSSERDVKRMAQELLRLRKAMEEEEGDAAEEDFITDRKEEIAQKEPEKRTITMPLQEMKKRFGLVEA